MGITNGVPKFGRGDLVCACGDAFDTDLTYIVLQVKLQETKDWRMQPYYSYYVYSNMYGERGWVSEDDLDLIQRSPLSLEDH